MRQLVGSMTEEIAEAPIGFDLVRLRLPGYLDWGTAAVAVG